MKKHIINLVFYLTCFIIVTATIYKMSFSIPPEPGMVGYGGYYWGTVAVCVAVGLLSTLPNLVIEYFMRP